MPWTGPSVSPRPQVPLATCLLACPSPWGDQGTLSRQEADPCPEPVLAVPLECPAGPSPTLPPGSEDVHTHFPTGSTKPLSFLSSV